MKNEMLASMNEKSQFRVIGIGDCTTEIIDAVNSWGYDFVEASVLTRPFDCAPAENDQMVIIVALDNEEHANRIAASFHDAGVLTLGLMYDPYCECFDSVMQRASYKDFASIIKSILQPIVTSGIIDFDFNDVKSTLYNSGRFLTASVCAHGANRIKDALEEISKTLTPDMLPAVENMALVLYSHIGGNHALTVKELTGISEFCNKLPQTTAIKWAVCNDETLKDDEIKLSVLGSGKELDS